MISRVSIFSAVMWMSLSALAHGAQASDTFRVNLDPLIDKAMRHRTQFAVEVARHADSERSGTWRIGEEAIWDYALQIPTAVSMAFHASRLRLPAEGTITISGGGRSFTTQASELHRAEFWSRPVMGDRIAIRITVPKQWRHQALLEIAGFQAGYRSLSSDIADHPHYSSLKAQVAAGAAGCVQNYACDASAATQNSANASVALIISNKFECSGTLLNDVAQDGSPFVLTARHCENGEDGGGDPGAAASVEVFWNAVTPCGQSLASIFNASTQIQFGASTVVEQQDEWLIRLDAEPAFSNAFFAGWDVTGAGLLGGYSVDYSGANTQQFVSWAGMAISEDLSAQALGLGYASSYFGVVNSLGSIDHGGSGSGLFNNSNLLVGSASRAAAAQCPVSSPPPPSTNTVSALFNKLASTWSSTADSTSTTGSTTLASTLDPGHTGATLLSGIAGVPPVADLSAAQSSAQIGSSVTLQFSGSAGSVCTATGGAPGDGWSGTLNANPAATTSVIESSAGVFSYGMTCVTGSRSSSAQVSVTWSLAAPTLSFYDQQFPAGLYAGAVNSLVWSSNQAACTASGGSAGDGWTGSLSGSGHFDLTESNPGTYLYTLSCGAGSQSISQTLTLSFAAPTASLSLSAQPGLRFGQTIALVWSGTGNCTASGGGAQDGWGGPLLGNFGVLYFTEQTLGTYVYSISCGPPAVAARAQVTYRFAGGSPTAALSATQPTQLIDLSVLEYPALLSWSSNVQPCSIDYTGPVSGNVLSGYPSQGSDTQPQQIAGTYTYTLTCGSGATQATSSATIQWRQQPTPKVTLVTEGANEFLLGGGYLAWTTNVLPCAGSGGTTGDGWNGTLPYYGGPGNFSAALISEPVAGTYAFTITCGVGQVATAQATAIYNNAGGSDLTLAPATSQVYGGQPTYFTWNSAVTPCTGYGGAAGDGWNGAQPQQGSAAVVEPPDNDYTLSLVCGVGSAAVEVQSTVHVMAAPIEVDVYIGANPVNSAVGHAVTLTWNGNEAASCVATGGLSGDGWTGTLPWNGQLAVVESQTGSVSYGLTCQNGSLSGQGMISVQWTAAPSVTLAASTQQAILGTPFTLMWSSANGAYACSASEDGASSGGAWGGSIEESGSLAIQEASGTTHVYAIACSSNYGSVQSQVIVNFTAAAPTSAGGSGTGDSGGSGSSAGSGSSGSSAAAGGSSARGSGGGGIDVNMIELLAAVLAMRFAPRGRARTKPD